MYEGGICNEKRAARLFFQPATGRRSGGDRLQACRGRRPRPPPRSELKKGRRSFLSGRALRLPEAIQAAKEPQV